MTKPQSDFKSNASLRSIATPSAAKGIPFRQIHLDFHTSEAIPEIGAGFDPEEYVHALKKAHVNSVTTFAKCHHGWCYYPTKVGTPHPHLARPDLLGEMIEVCRKNNIEVPIYITVQWDELMGRTRPDWKVVPKNASSANSGPNWSPVSLANDGLVDHIIALGTEVIERYDPPGIFADILLYWEDISQGSLARMKARGLDPEVQRDRLINDREVVLNFCDRFSRAAKALKPDIRVFHNSGHIFKNERERYELFDHLELESLPTGGWGYDHFPLSARYASTLGKPFLGMTGKFHNWWGDFGGYKQPVALEYECCQMVALGARCSIGDQLHPSGIIDVDTYDSIAPAYKRVEQLEPYISDATPVSQIAIYSAEGHFSRIGKNSDDPHDAGCSRILLESQIMFDVIDEQSDFNQYQLIILPDVITFEEGPLLDSFKDYLNKGGKLILSGKSGMSKELTRFALPFPAQVHGESEYEKEFLKIDRSFDARMPQSPFVIYEKAMNVSSDKAKVIGGICEPYFNRRHEHFCSHQHTPYKSHQKSDRQGIITTENILYFAHPICQEYKNAGQPIVKYAFVAAIRQLLGDLQVSANMKSAGRLSLMQQKEENRYILHLLFGQPQGRGSDVDSAHGVTHIEIIEDIVPVFDIDASVALDSKPKSVYSAYDKTPFESSFEKGRLQVRVPKLYIHEAIVIEMP